MKKMAVLIACVMAVLIGVGFYTFTIGEKKVDPNLIATLDKPGVKPGVKDNIGELGINSPDDVKYQVTSKKIKFVYGKQRFYILRTTLEDPTMKKYLERLHLKIQEGDKDGTYKIKYKGKEITEWAD